MDLFYYSNKTIVFLLFNLMPTYDNKRKLLFESVGDDKSNNHIELKVIYPRGTWVEEEL